MNTPSGRLFEDLAGDATLTKLNATQRAYRPAVPSDDGGAGGAIDDPSAIQPSGLDCLPFSGEAPAELQGKVAVVNCLTFATPHTFWETDAANLKARIDATYTRVDGATVGPHDWLAYDDWKCTKSLDIVLPACYKHDVALASLQKFAGVFAGSKPDGGEIDEAWNPRNKILADAKLYADIAEHDCYPTPSELLDVDLYLCSGASSSLADRYHWGAATVNNKDWPVTEQDLEHVGGPKEAIDANSAQYSFIICSPPVPRATNLTVTQVSDQTFRVSWDYEDGCVEDITIDSVEVCPTIHYGGPLYTRLDCTGTSNGSASYIDVLVYGWEGMNGLTAFIDLRLTPDDKIDFGGSNYRQVWPEVPIKR